MFGPSSMAEQEVQENDFLLLLKAGGGCPMHCHGVGKLAAITIAMNDAVFPGPRVSLVGMVLVAVPPVPWLLMTLIQGKLGHVLSL